MIKFSEDRKEIYLNGTAMDLLKEATNLYINVVIGVLKNLDEKSQDVFKVAIGESIALIVQKIKESENKEKGNVSENHQFRA